MPQTRFTKEFQDEAVRLVVALGEVVAETFGRRIQMHACLFICRNQRGRFVFD